jgi:hypothetical protein
VRRGYRISDGKSEGRKIFLIPYHRWKDNIKMYFKEVGCSFYGLCSFDSEYEKVADCSEYDDKLLEFIKRGEFLQ